MFSKYMSLGKVQWVGTENLKSLVLEEKCLVWEVKGIEQWSRDFAFTSQW